jgi:hypothetical protein
MHVPPVSATPGLDARGHLGGSSAGGVVRYPDGGRATGYGIMVLTVDGTMICQITGFADPALFRFFGLPATWSPDAARRGPRRPGPQCHTR